MSDSTPTEPLGAPTTPLPATPAATPASNSSRRLVIILASVGGVLLVAVLILIGVLIGRGGAAPAPEASESPTASASPTPTQTSASPTPEVSETETAPPPPTSNGHITSFTADLTTVDCTGASSVPLHFSWQADGVNLWFGVGTDNAKTAPYGSYPLSSSLDIDYQCGQPGGKQRYTISVEQANGDLQSQTITITERVG